MDIEKIHIFKPIGNTYHEKTIFDKIAKISKSMETLLEKLLVPTA